MAGKCIVALSPLEAQVNHIGEAMMRHLELMGRLSDQDKAALLDLKGVSVSCNAVRMF